MKTSPHFPAPIHPAILAANIALLFLLHPASAQVTWDAGSATNFNWSTPMNWNTDLEPLAANDVLFPTAVPNPGALASPNVLTLAAGEVANMATFNDAYTLNGGDLALGALAVVRRPRA